MTKNAPKPKRLPEAVSVRQTAEILGVHHCTVRRWIRRGFIKAYRIGPQIVRIPRMEIVRMRAVRLPFTTFKEAPDYPRV